MTTRTKFILLAAIIVAGAVIWSIMRRIGGDESDEPDKDTVDTSLDSLKTLPNYVPASGIKRTFANHTDFIRHVDDALIPTFPNRGARAMLVSHAATAGWHIPGRPPLYGNNLWGVVATKRAIKAGEAFTILRVPKKNRKFTSRVFPTMEAAVHQYVDNVNWYGTGGIAYLATLGETVTKEEMYNYCVLIQKWFKRSERNLTQLRVKAGKWHWIYRNKYVVAVS